MTVRRLVVVDDADLLASTAADHLAEVVGTSTEGARRCRIALSGGRTPWAMLAELAGHDLPWGLVDVFQVDERIAPDGDPARNLTHLRAALPAAAVVHPMPVDAADPEAAAREYALHLPERFDLVHLGLGPDGHTASLVPGDAALDVSDRDVAVTGEYQGHRRMTLTFPALARAGQVLWLVSGADKVAALRALLADDLTIPAARVSAPDQLVLADRAAAPN